MAKKKKRRLPPVCDVGYFSRFFAYLLDYYFGLLLCSLPIVLANGILNGSDKIQMNLFFFEGPTLYVVALLSLLVGYVYYIHIPLRVWKGQTVAKRLLHFKIVKTTGDEVDRKTLLLRHAVGMMLVEGAVISCTSVVRQLITYCTGFNLVDPWIYAGMAITLVSCVVMFLNRNRRMLHDLIADTMVTKDTYQKE